MAQVSLLSTGAQLGKTTGQVRLGLLRANGYTRDFATAGYLRVNPFQVENGNGQDPDEAGAQHRLGDWLNYLQGILNTGSELLVESSYGEVRLSWTKPAGYDRAPAILEQQMYMKGTGETEINTTSTSVNPFSAPDSKIPAGDGTSGTIPAGSFGGTVVAVGVKVEFDDSATLHTNTDATAYDIAAGQDPLIGGGRGVAVKVYDVAPTITNVSQSPDRADCVAGSDVTVTIHLDMEGPSLGTLQESVNGGAFTTINSSVAAGSTAVNLTRASDGTQYSYRIRYNDVSPDQWSNTADYTPVCDLI